MSRATTSAPPPEHRHGWLDHPLVAAHFRERAAIDGLDWQHWVTRHLGAPPRRSLQLMSGTGAHSFYLFENGLAEAIDGIEHSEEAVTAAERSREACLAPGMFRAGDLNSVSLPRDRYDLIFIAHGLHQVPALEHLLDQVYAALTPRGVFVVEGYVGPSRFQWTDAQIAVTALATSWLPDPLRTFRWGAVKPYEARPEREKLAELSLFEAMRSGEIVPLLRDRFAVVAERPLGGTIQHLLYNGIIHNFAEDDAEARAHLERTWQLEDTLVDAGLLASDFLLTIGRRR